MKAIQCFSCFSIVLFLAINIICGKALYCYMCKRWLLYCMPATLLLKMRAESYEQWKLIALRISLSAPKLLYQCSGTSFLCQKTNRSIFKNKWKNQTIPMNACPLLNTLPTCWRPTKLLHHAPCFLPDTLWAFIIIY